MQATAGDFKLLRPPVELDSIPEGDPLVEVRGGSGIGGCRGCCFLSREVGCARRACSIATRETPGATWGVAGSNNPSSAAAAEIVIVEASGDAGEEARLVDEERRLAERRAALQETLRLTEED